MPCIHGLDEINCPICRIIEFSVPQNAIKIEDLYYSQIRPIHPFYESYLEEEKEFNADLKPDVKSLNFNHVNEISNPNLLNNLPDFKNKMFSERIKELDLQNTDTFNIYKKVSLTSSELKYNKED
ncbi:MAG: hypothetical protein EU539_08655 [Promethearchaeota archaeon]|nr:MAG: hypothetical protein EU539_08655 [Candidatus Lokiarchaeota archaeon]